MLVQRGIDLSYQTARWYQGEIAVTVHGNRLSLCRAGDDAR